MSAPEDRMVCPKCLGTSGDDWSQCNKKCPVSCSIYFDENTFAEYGPLLDSVTGNALIEQKRQKSYEYWRKIESDDIPF